MEPLWTTKEIANYYRITEQAVSVWIKQGMPVAKRFGRNNRFNFKDVDAWLDEREKNKEDSK